MLPLYCFYLFILDPLRLFHLQSCVDGVLERRGERSVLVQLPHLQDFGAAPDGLTLRRRATGPLAQSQTSTHAGTERRPQAHLLLEKDRGWKMSARALPVCKYCVHTCAPLVSGSHASCGS